MHTGTDLENIKEMIIREVPGTAGIILFGSYADGTARTGSDLDIMILIESEFAWREKRDILNRIYQQSARSGLTVDFLLKLKDNYEKDKTLPTVSRVIQKAGKVLWTKV